MVLRRPEAAAVPILRADTRLQTKPKRTGAFQLGLGCLAALLLHGGLVAALVLGQNAPLLPPLNPPAVSLLLQPGRPAMTVPRAPVAPRPAAALAIRPPSPPALIATAPPVRPLFARQPPARQPPARQLPARLPPARQLAIPGPGPAAAPAASESSATADRNRVQQQAAADRFVAARPLAGNANPPPEYPQAAVEHGEQGAVLLSIHVLPDGRTDFVAVTRSSGYRVLDQAASDAVMQWRFQPALMAGKPVVMVIPYWIHFNLQTQRATPSDQ